MDIIIIILIVCFEFLLIFEYLRNVSTQIQLMYKEDLIPEEVLLLLMLPMTGKKKKLYFELNTDTYVSDLYLFINERNLNFYKIRIPKHLVEYLKIKNYIEIDDIYHVQHGTNLSIIYVQYNTTVNAWLSLVKCLHLHRKNYKAKYLNKSKVTINE